MPTAHNLAEHTAVKDALKTAFETAYLEMRIAARTELARLDSADPKTLTSTVEALLELQVEQKQLADWLGVSRTTISRWAQNQNIPRSPAFRKWAVATLRDHLSKAIESAQHRQQGGRANSRRTGRSSTAKPAK